MTTTYTLLGTKSGSKVHLGLGRQTFCGLTAARVLTPAAVLKVPETRYCASCGVVAIRRTALGEIGR